MGALLNMPLIDRFGLGKASFKDIYLFLSQDSKFYSSDTRGRVSLPDCSMSYSISFPIFVLSFGLAGMGMPFQVRIMK